MLKMIGEIKCSHPMSKIKVVFVISSRDGKYITEIPQARCRQCRLFLPKTDSRAMMAMDLVWASLNDKNNAN